MSDSTTQQALQDGQQRLAKDLRAVVEDAEALLRQAVQGAGQGYGDARARLEQTLKSARSELSALEGALADGVYQAGRAADHYVHRHPWESIGIGAGIGVLVGLLLGRR